MIQSVNMFLTANRCPPQGVERAFNIYTALHFGLPDMLCDKFKQDGTAAAHHNSNENAYSLITANGYANLVKREFWESVNLETAAFEREIFALLGEPGILEVLFAIFRRNFGGPANFKMIKDALVNAKLSDEQIQSCLDKLIERNFINTENSSYDEIGKIYKPNDRYYLGLCAIICAAQVLKISLSSLNCWLGIGAWSIKL